MYMHGGGPSPSGSSFRHSYGLAAVSSAHTSARGRFAVYESPNLSYIPKAVQGINNNQLRSIIKQRLTIISANCHQISLPDQSHHMPITRPRPRALNHHSTIKLNFFYKNNDSHTRIHASESTYKLSSFLASVTHSLINTNFINGSNLCHRGLGCVRSRT